MTAIQRARVVQTSKAWQASQRGLKRLTESEVAVGVIEGGEHDSESGLSHAQLLAIHEYGSPKRHIPERSVLRSTLKAEAATIRDILGEGLREASTGGGLYKVTSHRLLAAAGRLLTRRIRARFGSQELKPLKPYTLANSPGRKGGPLLDTGKLRRAIRYKVMRRGVAEAQGGDE